MASYIMGPAFAPAFSPAFSPAPSPAHHHHYHHRPLPIKLCSCPCPHRIHNPVFSPELVRDLRVLVIMASVLVTIILMYLLFFLGRIRRSIRWNFYIAYITKISYVALPIAITYIMGVLHKDPNPHQLFPVLAATLVYAYGGVVTISACDLRDNDETLGYVLQTLPLFFWTFWLMFLVFDIITYRSMAALVITLGCFLALGAINARQTLEAFYKASRSKGLPREVEPLERHMKAQIKPGDYIVWGRKNNADRPDPTIKGRENNVTTIDEVWEWVSTDEENADRPDPRKRWFLAKCGHKEELRDLCLSYALFRILLIRLAGFPTPNQSRLFQEGIIEVELSEEPQRNQRNQRISRRVFRIIEVELDFLFEHFYTKSHVCASYRFRDIWQNLAQILFVGCVAAFGVPIVMGDRVSYHSIDFKRIEVVVTISILLMVVVLESVKYLMVHFSNRKLVWLVCTGIKETASFDKWAHTTEKRIVWIWTVKRWLSSKCFFWPWQRKLGQYSFLNNYGRVPLSARKLFSPLSKIVKRSRTGQKGDYVVPLSDQVKQAIISSLVPDRELNLSRWRNTRYPLPRRCQSDSIDISFILVWHIATSFCESLHPIDPPIDPEDREHEHFVVANQLSQYCAYLVAFTPELLPNHHVYTMESVFDEAVEQANNLKVGSLNHKETHQIKKELERLVGSGSSANEDNIIVGGALLADKLSRDIMVEDANRGWRVLAEFWAELLLYLASSPKKKDNAAVFYQKEDNAAVHVEYLAKGGEFITHLWVLVTHAGVVTTDPSSTTNPSSN